MLDLSRIVAGPFAGMILGDLGADVIKVERAGSGDDPRRWGPPFLGSTAAYFLAVNRNRRSLAVDLADPGDRALVTRLAAAADVVLENFLPAQAAKLGLDAVREAAGGAVWVSVRGAGSNGPDGDAPGVDAMVQARSGLMGVTGHPATGPVKVGVPVVDVVAGLYAAVAALAGLVARERTGARPHFEVPLLESAVSALMNQAANHLVGGMSPALMGNDHPNIVPYGPFSTADGLVFLGATSELQFSRLVAMLGCPELAGDDAFASNAGRLAHREELVRMLSERTATATTGHWLAAARDHGVLAGPVNDVAGALDDAHVRASGLVAEVETPDGPLRLVGSPILVDGRRPPVRLPPPALGQHDAQIRAALGRPPAGSGPRNRRT